MSVSTEEQMRERPTTSNRTARRARIGSRTSTRGVLGAVSLGLIGLATVPSAAWAAEDLVLIPDLTTLVVLVALFFALIYPVNKLIFEPIFQALDERAARIEGARQRADHIAAEADAVLERYEASIREARAAAEESRKELIAGARDEQASIAASARSDAEVLVDKAKTDLGRALDEARAGLRTTSEELGKLAAERILGRTF